MSVPPERRAADGAGAVRQIEAVGLDIEGADVDAIMEAAEAALPGLGLSGR